MKLLSLMCLMSLLYACSPSSVEDFQHEGEARSKRLIKELKKIESRDQLLRAEPELKHHFGWLVELMIAAREFQEMHPDEAILDPNPDAEVSTLLEEELRRIYALEGGREIVERAQQEALERLDAFERLLKKRKENAR